MKYSDCLYPSNYLVFSLFGDRVSISFICLGNEYMSDFRWSEALCSKLMQHGEQRLTYCLQFGVFKELFKMWFFSNWRVRSGSGLIKPQLWSFNLNMNTVSQGLVSAPSLESFPTLFRIWTFAELYKTWKKNTRSYLLELIERMYILKRKIV